jgi:MFS family permease
VALFGNALSLVAMPLLAYRLTGSAALTALVASATFWPYLAFGLIAGALADRVNRRRVMVWSGLASGALLATVPFASVGGWLAYPHLLGAQLAIASLFVFSDAAAFGILPQLVGRSGLASATSALMILSTSVNLIGPAVAGLLVSLVDPALVIGLDAVAYVLVALSIARLRWNGADRPERLDQATLGGDIVEGLRFIWRTHILRWLTLFGFGASFALGGVTGLLVVIGVEQLGLADDAPQIGWLYAANAVGTLAGSSLLPLLQRHYGIGRITAVGLASAFSMLLALSTARSLPVALILIVAFQVPLMALILNAMVARSVITPDQLQSRVNTTGRMVAGGGSPFGAVVAGVIADAAGTEWALRAVGAGLLVSLVGVLLVGVYRYPHLRHLSPVTAPIGR